MEMRSPKMKKLNTLSGIALTVFLAGLLVAGTATAEDGYSISHWTIAGGGTLDAEGGEWQLAGTIGQWEATEPRALSGGQWRLTGGFWGLSLEELAEFLFQDRFEASADTNNVELEASS